MENTTIIRRCSEILTALIVVFTTIVFIYTNTRHMKISAYDVLSASKAQVRNSIGDGMGSSSLDSASESKVIKSDESISNKSNFEKLKAPNQNHTPMRTYRKPCPKHRSSLPLNPPGCRNRFTNMYRLIY